MGSKALVLGLTVLCILGASKASSVVTALRAPALLPRTSARSQRDVERELGVLLGEPSSVEEKLTRDGAGQFSNNFYRFGPGILLIRKEAMDGFYRGLFDSIPPFQPVSEEEQRKRSADERQEMIDRVWRCFEEAADSQGCLEFERVKEDGVDYIGRVCDGKAHGAGICKYSNGCVYMGDFRKGVRHGWGRMDWAAVRYSYEGTWRSDLQAPHLRGFGMPKIFDRSPWNAPRAGHRSALAGA
mmetsp:Transcript_2328/g.5538  ORF Transcript_2328/g.5538 Transcript_2328/m.5538 type:complete len:242 (+) Transcript_2328:97-822(+)